MKRAMVYFDFPNGTQKQYDAVWEDLKTSGNEHPKGLIFHTGAPKPGGGWIVVDLWDSEESFKEFSKILMPFIQKAKFENVQPKIMAPHFVYQNVYQVQREEALS